MENPQSKNRQQPSKNYKTSLSKSNHQSMLIKNANDLFKFFNHHLINDM